MAILDYTCRSPISNVIAQRQFGKNSFFTNGWMDKYEKELGKMTQVGSTDTIKRKKKRKIVDHKAPAQRSYHWNPSYDLEQSERATRSPKFLIGIEFEGMLNDDISRDFKAYMHDLACDKSGRSIISFGVDNSVKNVPAGYSPIEIRTKTMELERGLEVFELMLSYLYLFSETEDFKTNQYCGLHINISEERTFGADNQEQFYFHVLRDFDEDNILKTFKRVKNRYCLAFFRDVAACERDIDCIEKAYIDMKEREKVAAANGLERESRESKYLSVSLRDSPAHGSYDGEFHKAERIEFRCIGNTDYHLRFDDLKVSVNHMLDTVHKAYNAIQS